MATELNEPNAAVFFTFSNVLLNVNASFLDVWFPIPHQEQNDYDVVYKRQTSVVQTQLFPPVILSEVSPPLSSLRVPTPVSGTSGVDMEAKTLLFVVCLVGNGGTEWQREHSAVRARNSHLHIGGFPNRQSDVHSEQHARSPMTDSCCGPSQRKQTMSGK